MPGRSQRFSAAGPLAPQPGLAEDSAPFEHEADIDLPLDKRETLELVRAYYRIGDAAVRKRLFELAKALGNLDHQKNAPDM